MGKDKRQTTTTRLDPNSQAYQDQIRGRAQAAAGSILQNPNAMFLGPDERPISEQIAQFMNPYTQSVIGNLGTEFDRLRQQATVGANQAATRANAFGSSRHDVLQAERLAALDRAQMQQVGGLLSGQFNAAMQQGLQHSEYMRALRERQAQEPLFRQQMAQQFLQGGLGPTGQTMTQVTPGNLVGDIAGLGLMAAGAFTGNPAAVARGAMSTYGAAPGGGVVNPTLGSVFDPAYQRKFMQGLPDIPRPAGY